MTYFIQLSGKRSFIVLFSVLFLAVIVSAQSEESKENAYNRISKSVNLIVTDKDGNFVNQFDNSDVAVYIDGKIQPEIEVKRETRPLMYMIAVDNTGSMRFLLDEMNSAARTIIGKNSPEDLTALMRFVSSDKIQTTEKFTSDTNYLFRIIDGFYVEGGITALVDAIYQSVELVAGQKTPEQNYRRAVIVISDGEDRDSKKTQKELTKLLIENDVQIFFIGMVNELGNERGIVSKSSKQKALEFIDKVAGDSGGTAIMVKKKGDISTIADQIGVQMRNQFVIKFQIDENLDPNKIKIKLTKEGEKRKIKLNFRIR